MEIIREVDCRVMKGLGPEWVSKTVTVVIDDVEPGTSESEIIDMVRADVKDQLRKAGFIRFTLGEINNA